MHNICYLIIHVYVRIMESNGNNSSPIARMIPVFIIFLGLLGLYYLYQYLFGPKMNNSFPLITATQNAQVDKEITFSSGQLAPLYEGGEFTFSTWIYVSNWSYRAGKNKSIIRIGGNSFDTIRVYLGANTPKLYVRLHTKEDVSISGAGAPAASAASPTPVAPAPSTGAVPSTGAATTALQPEDLRISTLDSVFKNPQTESGLLDNLHICDIPELPLQRWINISIAVNGKTVDVYIDGKLSRSCVLSTPFKVDAGYNASLLGYGGFGGQISTTTMYDTALNPEEVYKNYMAGPEPITSLSGLFSSFFAPNVHITVS